MKIGGLEVIFGLYIFSSIYVALTSFAEGYFPESSSFPGFKFDSSNLGLNLLLVLFFYFMLFLLFLKLKKSRKAVFPRIEKGFSMGLFTLLSQGVLLYYIISESALTASKANFRGASTAGYLNALLVPDYLFLVYYSFARKSFLSFFNMLVYVFSTVIRGWGGGILLILFFKIIQLFRKKHLHTIAMILVLGVVVGPFVYEMRGAVRSQGWFDFQAAGEIVESTFMQAYLLPSHDGGVVLTLFSTLFNRLSHLPSPVMISDNLELFRFGDLSGRFAPFFAIGKLQEYLTMHRFIGIPELSEYLTTQFFPTPYGTWYIHPGLIGWLWVNPFLFPLLLAYCALLIFSGFFLMQGIGGGKAGMQGVFLFVLLFLINGWFAPFTYCLQAMVLFWFLKILLRLLVQGRKIIISMLKFKKRNRTEFY